MRETTAAPGSAPASATELVLFFLDDDGVHPACDSGGRGTTRARHGWRGASTPWTQPTTSALGGPHRSRGSGRSQGEEAGMNAEGCRFFDKAHNSVDTDAREEARVRDPSLLRACTDGTGEPPCGVRASDTAAPTSGSAARGCQRESGRDEGRARGTSVMKSVALYARVSSEQQEKQATVGSQVAALTERAKADGHVVVACDSYVDEGYSGSTLVRPALEKLRDRAAEGGLDLLYVHSPDRLARKYAYQVLLLEELSRNGVSVVFLNGPTSRSAEDELLVQVQGMIAEYERAKILERSRRGKLHKARSGVVSPLSGAPYGYRYVRKTDAEPARYQILLHEAKVVRQIFHWFLDEQLSLRAIVKRLNEQGVPTRTGLSRWPSSTLWCVLRNPAYAGRAAYGKTEVTPKSVVLRPLRGTSGVARKLNSSTRLRPASEWLSIPVPAILSEEVFATAQEQLLRNRNFAARNARGKRYLLQGLVVCACCGYGYHGRTVGKPLKGTGLRLSYYFCGGTKAGSFGGTPICHNPYVRADHLHEHVWASVKSILQEPERVVDEWTRRAENNGGAVEAREQHDKAQRFLAAQEQALRRLQDAYEAGAFTVEELSERTERVRARIVRANDDLAESQASFTRTVELRALAGQLTTFAEHVRAGVDHLDWHGQRQLIRTLVSRVAIDEAGATIVYRIPGIPRRPGEPLSGGDDPSMSVVSKERAPRAAEGAGSAAAEPLPPDARDTLPATSRAA